MKRRRCGCLLIVGIGVLTAAPLLSAQPPPRGGVSPEVRERSHITLPPSAGRAEVERLLKDRLGRAQDLHKARELLEHLLKQPDGYFSKQDLDELRKRVNEGPPDLSSVPPEVIDQLKKWVEQQKKQPNPDHPLPPDQLDSLNRLLEEHEHARRADPPPGAMPPHRATTPPRPAGEPMPRGDPTPPASVAGDVRERQQMLRMLERVFGKSGRESDTLKRAQEDLRQQRLRQMEEWLPIGEAREGLRSRLPELSRTLRLERFLQEGESLFSSRPKTLDLDWRGGQSSSGGGVPAISPSDAGGSGWKVALAGVLAIALLAALGKAFGARGRREAAANGGWKLGPWPVHPAAVRTCDELIRAFEYLTLLRLGPVARCWNHLEIADRLGQADTASQTAAAELAGLYEQARYAPPPVALPGDDLEAARRHLCFLAGVSAA